MKRPQVLALAAGFVMVAVAAFFVIPVLGGVANYPSLHTPDLAQLSAWARAHTDRDAVFVFPGAGLSLALGARVDLRLLDPSAKLPRRGGRGTLHS